MPKLIDHAAREVQIAEAAWRVAVRDGVRAVSVRSVATEAGLATASLRRAFPTQNALLAYCLELAGRRVRERTAAAAAGLAPREAARAVLRQLLPLDAERRLEMEVFLLIGALALTDADLRPGYDAAHAELAVGCRGIVLALEQVGQARAGLDPDMEAARLHALVDGLALHLLRLPEGEDTAWAEAVLDAHLDSLR
ncbi:TetR/AcrR family transcriptional regulator [Kineococcus arenarius]|uniref:TetR/AcrR family transcriptional regulator n=1 Tax=Kineococcus sp. SYSU DK007 TaxID=3383128 RepID=UPI003D7EAC33